MFGKNIGEAARKMVNVIPELLLLLLLPSPFTLIGSAALDFYFCLLAFTVVPEERIGRERKKKKHNVSPAGGPTLPPDCVLLSKVSVAPGRDGPIRSRRGEGAGQGWGRGVTFHHDRSGASNCLIHSIKVIQLVILSGSDLV